jgi:hypothetical protein
MLESVQIKKIRKPHVRRPNAELQREINCPFPDCDRVYGQQQALNLHLQRKHATGHKTTREQSAKGLVETYAKGLRIGKDRLRELPNIPPGLVQEMIEVHSMHISPSQLRLLEEDISELNRIHAEQIQSDIMRVKQEIVIEPAAV